MKWRVVLESDSETGDYAAWCPEHYAIFFINAEIPEKEGRKWNDLDDDWACSVCESGKSYHTPVENSAPESVFNNHIQAALTIVFICNTMKNIRMIMN